MMHESAREKITRKFCPLAGRFFDGVNYKLMRNKTGASRYFYGESDGMALVWFTFPRLRVGEVRNRMGWIRLEVGKDVDTPPRGSGYSGQDCTCKRCLLSGFQFVLRKLNGDKIRGGFYGEDANSLR